MSQPASSSSPAPHLLTAAGSPQDATATSTTTPSTTAPSTTAAAASGLPGAPEPPALPGWEHLSSGKVRDIYTPEAGGPWAGRDVLLVVASDRISAYDHVLPTPIPDKGRVLTANIRNIN